MQCPACGEQQLSGIRFCEDCGARLDAPGLPPAAVAVAEPPARVCPLCGAERDADDASGFCSRCGFEHASVIGDHLEMRVSDSLAGVTDVGRVRTRNEDFLALASKGGVDVLVVCDGVSNSQQADRAARAAATVVCENMLKRIGSGDIHAALLESIHAADAAVRALPDVASHPGDPAETTLVAAVRSANRLVIGWLGDSRAYWLDAAGLRQLTVDHSWVSDVVADELMTHDEAMLQPQAHAITRTLGGPPSDHGGDEPSMIEFELGQNLYLPGTLLLCTDGFWDFHRDSGKFGILVIRWIEEMPVTTAALTLAQKLVENACRERGHDNVTVALLRVDKAMGQRSAGS